MTSYTVAPTHDMADAGDEAAEPRLNPSEAYALVLGHRQLRVNFVQMLHKA